LLFFFQKKNAIPATAATATREPTTAPTITPVLSSSSSEAAAVGDVGAVATPIAITVGVEAPARAGLLAMTAVMAAERMVGSAAKATVEAVTVAIVTEEVAESTYTVKVIVTAARRTFVATDVREVPVFSVHTFCASQSMIPTEEPYPYSVATFVAPMYAAAPPWRVTETACVIVSTVAGRLFMSIVVSGATYPLVGAEVVGAEVVGAPVGGSVGARVGARVEPEPEPEPWPEPWPEPEPEPEPEPVRLLWEPCGEMYCGTSDSMKSKSTDSRDGLVDVTSDA